MHFFMVALFGVGRLLLPRPTIKGVWMSVLLLLSACEIIFPIIASEGVMACFLPGLASGPKTDSSLAPERLSGTEAVSGGQFKLKGN